MSHPDPASTREGRLLPWFVPVLATLWLGLRFVGLEQNPPGFYGDEFRGALHMICLGETGASAYGERWPVFVPGAGGGFYTPPFLYFGAAWAKVFGYSIASFRAIGSPSPTPCSSRASPFDTCSKCSKILSLSATATPGPLSETAT